MIQISSANIVYGKYLWLILTVVGNLVVYISDGSRISWGDFIGFNIGSLFTAGTISVYAFRLWDASVSGSTVLMSRGNVGIEFDISEIKNIEAIPNLLSKGLPPFVNIILKEPVDGKTEFKFLPSRERLDESLLIHPWRELYRERVQQSMKRRGARR